MTTVSFDSDLLIKSPVMLDSTGRAMTAELVKQTSLLAKLADTTPRAAMLESWAEVADAIAGGLGEYIMPIGSQFAETWTTMANSSATESSYTNVFDTVHHGNGALADGETIPVMFAQMHYCLPFDTQFSPSQAFLYAIDGLPAGTYNVTVSSDIYGRAAGTYQFTLANALPAGGQLAGFFSAGTAAKVKAYASQTATDPIEACDVSSGNGGTSLGTFSTAGIAVPASGTPATAQSVTIDGTTYTYYGLNSLQRVSYGNNRWLHSPLRQYLNANGFGWWSPATVFDRPPAYVSRNGFLSGFSDEFVSAMKPIAMKTALNYLTDGGTSESPLYDTTYDKVFLPSGRQHFIADTSAYGGAGGQEGDQWEYWERVLGSSLPASWGSTYPEYKQYGLDVRTTARYCWLRSAYRSSGYSVTCVTSSGYCTTTTAYNAYRAAPACAIG